MKIVIEISEKDYLDFMLQYDNGILDEKTPSHRAKIAIANGTPLPKGHGRLIDADETISKICGNSCGCHLEECGHDEPCFSVTRIKSAQTIIEADEEGAKMEGSDDDDSTHDS